MIADKVINNWKEKNETRKIKKRVEEIKNILAGDWKHIDSHALICEQADKEFILNKQGVNIRLTGNNKYYWGHQFKNLEII